MALLNLVVNVRDARRVGGLVVLWHECGISPDEVWAEMRRRADKLGIAEKLPKSPGRHASAAECGK